MTPGFRIPNPVVLPEKPVVTVKNQTVRKFFLSSHNNFCEEYVYIYESKKISIFPKKDSVFYRGMSDFILNFPSKRLERERNKKFHKYR